ncbi:MAG: helix-turn-helix transcriptional regulator [Eubacteriales bacterium]|nr:helix-turn-helix transcriptional regulator [Eubacteriales bacterium]
MTIGDTIRKFRREKQLTQEEMARRLGVSTPAVNKWENGVSYPDIMLVAPIARLLGISTDELLSYEGNLTPAEEQQIIAGIFDKFKTTDYQQVYLEAMAAVKKYPGNDSLILQLAQILDTYRGILGVENPRKYDEDIIGLYAQVLDSSEPVLVQQALLFLFYHYLNTEDYEKAQEYLSRMPKLINSGMQSPKVLQAVLSRRQGKREEAYRLYEELLYSSYTEAGLYLSSLCNMYQEDGEKEKVEKFTKLRVTLAEQFDMGAYHRALPEFDVAAIEKDAEKCLDKLAEMVEGMKGINGIFNSDLFCHIEKSKIQGWSNMAFMLKKSIEQDESMKFLREDTRYKKIMDMLDSYMGDQEADSE